MNAKHGITGTSPLFRKEHQLDNGLDDLLLGDVSGVLPTYPRLSINSAALREILIEDICPIKFNLMPPTITWKQWCEFSSSFNAITNDSVAPRYHYGKLQLSRLHWLVRIRLRELNYYYIDGGYGDSFARYYGQLLFLFGILSVLLVQCRWEWPLSSCSPAIRFHFGPCKWFSVASFLLCALVTFYLVLSFIIKSLDELVWAARAQYRARPRSKSEMTSTISQHLDAA